MWKGQLYHGLSPLALRLSITLQYTLTYTLHLTGLTPPFLHLWVLGGRGYYPAFKFCEYDMIMQPRPGQGHQRRQIQNSRVSLGDPIWVVSLTSPLARCARRGSQAPVVGKCKTTQQAPPPAAPHTRRSPSSAIQCEIISFAPARPTTCQCPAPHNHPCWRTAVDQDHCCWRLCVVDEKVIHYCSTIEASM